MLVLAVLQIVSWRTAFQIFALLGIAWAIIFFRWFRDSPHEHPSVNEAERQLLDQNVKLASHEVPIPWRLFLRSSTAWLLWLQYAALSYVWYFYITWFPTYLDSVSRGRLQNGVLRRATEASAAGERSRHDLEAFKRRTLLRDTAPKIDLLESLKTTHDAHGSRETARRQSRSRHRKSSGERQPSENNGRVIRAEATLRILGQRNRNCAPTKSHGDAYSSNSKPAGSIGRDRRNGKRGAA
jgi:hypothetical protein